MMGDRAERRRVLDYPELPLHHNRSARAIRARVKKCTTSAGARREARR